MAIVVPNAAEEKQLRRILSETVTVKLFKNDVTPSATSTAATFTEATFTGYADADVTSGQWGYTQGAPCIALSDTILTFEASAGSQTDDIYGYYVVDASDGELMWAERFSDGPYEIRNDGDAISFTPRYTATSEN